MNGDLSALFRKYRKKGILLDTNILLLYFVGTFKPKQILRSKRTQTFTIEDYYLLLDIINFFEKRVTTPNILTEVSNLLEADCFDVFVQGIVDLLDEKFLASAEVAKTEKFSKYGLTDIGILLMAKGAYLVLTDDFRLSQYLLSQGVDSINFNHIRTLGWQ